MHGMLVSTTARKRGTRKRTSHPSPVWVAFSETLAGTHRGHRTRRRGESRRRVSCFQGPWGPERGRCAADRGRRAGGHGDGGPAVHQPARGAPVVRAHLARRQRALRGEALRGRRAVAARDADPRGDRRPHRRARDPRRRPRLVFSALDAVSPASWSGPSRPPATSWSATRVTTAWTHGAAPRPGGERRSPRAPARAGEAARRQGRHRHQPQLLDRVLTWLSRRCAPSASRAS